MEKVRPELLEFLMDLADIKDYLDENMYHNIFSAFSDEDGERILKALKALCGQMNSLKAEIKQLKEEIKQQEEKFDKAEEDWKMQEKYLRSYLDKSEKLERELRKIYKSPSGKFLMAKDMYENGKSLSEIAKKLGVNRETVKKHLISLGVEIRDNKGGRPKSPVKNASKYDDLYVDIDEIATDIE